jgi:type II secretory pathway component PulF
MSRIYSYRAVREDGSPIRGTVEAVTAAGATGLLAARGLFPLSIEALAPGPRSSRRRVSRHELAIIFRGLATLVGAGLPIERALNSVAPLTRGALRTCVEQAAVRLKEGQGLAQALETADEAVPGLARGMLRAGERGGRLANALDQVAAHLEYEAELVARLRQALAYPLLLLFSGLGSVLVLGTLVIPRLAAILSDLGQEVPLATRVLLTGSDLLVRYGLLALPVSLGAGWAAWSWCHAGEGRRWLHRTLLDVPFVGPVRLGLASSRAARALGAALGAGLPLLPALDLAREAAGDDALGARLARARERVARGEPLGTAIQLEGALDSSALQLVAVGESSGRLADMVSRAGDLAAREAERRLRTLVGLIEPGLIVVIGGLVAFVAIALLQAVYSLRPGDI